MLTANPKKQKQDLVINYLKLIYIKLNFESSDVPSAKPEHPLHT